MVYYRSHIQHGRKARLPTTLDCKVWLPALMVAILTALVLAGCDSSPVQTSNHTPLLRIRVSDTAGNPVEGLRIGSINHSDLLEKPDCGPQCYRGYLLTVDIPDSGNYVFSILNYYREPIAWQADFLGSGFHQFNWLLTDHPCGYYYFHVESEEGPGTFIYDSAFVAERYVHAAHRIIGTTDSNGVFWTNDTLLLPCLLGAPPTVICTDEIGRVIDTTDDFYDNTVTFTLSDSSCWPDAFQYFEKPLIVGKNHLELTRDPSQDEGPYAGITETDASGQVIREDPWDWCPETEDHSAALWFPARPNPTSSICIFRYLLPADSCPLSIQVLDQEAGIVKELYGPCEGGFINEVYWDLTNSDGNRLAPGIYRCRLRWGACWCQGDVRITEQFRTASQGSVSLRDSTSE